MKQGCLNISDGVPMPLVREGKGQFGGMLVLGQSLGDDLLITSGSTRMHGLSVLPTYTGPSTLDKSAGF